MIQNYCNLTLDAMTVRGLNALYVLSNNCGNILINNTTITVSYTHLTLIYNEYSNNIREYIEHDKKLPEGWAMCRLE